MTKCAASTPRFFSNSMAAGLKWVQVGGIPGEARPPRDALPAKSKSGISKIKSCKSAKERAFVLKY
ncbi:MAG: hypothetical protein E2O77_03050 [Caldithrix sp.]|nr:MAG: hypothetical protein E2O77_03050 [Caldithrix sp.]